MGRKTTVWILQATKWKDYTQASLNRTKKRKPLEKNCISFFIAAKNNAIRANYIKAKIDKTQQNSKYRVRGDRDELVNHTRLEWSKLAQKEYNIRHDWVGTEIHWELCKRLKFDHTPKWYMHKSESVLGMKCIKFCRFLRYSQKTRLGAD